jgi:2-polyprenyl-6-methoxyphenol hydroxylase-like FAD-dependent oxidoreductase
MKTPVLIGGGGPVGLAMAGDLGWRGIPCMLIEKTDDRVTQPRMDMVHVHHGVLPTLGHRAMGRGGRL